MSLSILTLFGWVLANQAGAPVPVAPWLVAVGALARGGHPSFAAVLGSAVAAALAADLVWYGLGRWRGTQALATGVRFLRLPPAAVDRVTGAVRTHEAGVMWSVRFLPELNPIAAGLAGAVRVPLPRFLWQAAGTALAWAGLWAGAGYVLGGMANGRFATDLTAPVAGAVSILMMIAGAYVVFARLRQGLVADAGGTT
jgi:membrane protein DedA with SNARE-associated domain